MDIGQGVPVFCDLAEVEYPVCRDQIGKTCRAVIDRLSLIGKAVPKVISLVIDKMENDLPALGTGTPGYGIYRKTVDNCFSLNDSFLLIDFDRSEGAAFLGLAAN